MIRANQNSLAVMDQGVDHFTGADVPDANGRIGRAGDDDALVILEAEDRPAEDGAEVKLGSTIAE